MRKKQSYTKVEGLLLATLFFFAGAAFAGKDVEVAPYLGDTFWGTACKGTVKYQDVFDYTLRNQFQPQLKLTEKYHFTRQVESLIAGASSSYPLQDVDFTLTRWPNHHRALNTAITARLRDVEGYRKTRYTPAECYLQRAINFSPNDAMSHMLYGILLQRVGRFPQALEEYELAETLQPDDLQIQYNMGLLLVELGQYEEAERYARAVYSRGFSLPGLERKLTNQGYMKTPAVGSEVNTPDHLEPSEAGPDTPSQ